MNTPGLLPTDDPISFPSMPTLRGGGASRPGEPLLGCIDHYDLLRKLGGGGFGVVYLARDSVSGIEVALKTLHPLLKTNAEEMDALREKFRLVHGLTHPNIAKALVLHPVRDVNIWDEAARQEMRLLPGDSVMVMDYAPGVTLSRWRRQFPDGIVPPDLALEIGRQLASALDYAHGERIVHRDIKPGNIMVETLRADEPRGASDHEVDAAQCAASGRQDDEKTRRQGPASETLGGRGSISRQPVIPSSRRPPHVRVRLLDFGLAAEIRSSMSRVSTETGDTSGTRPYMAPEQWLGKKQDGRTDQYALACVLYEMLSGAPPFAGVFETGDPIIMMTTVENRAPDEIEDLDPAINAALLRALSKAPKDRFSSCSAFIAALSPETRKPDIPETRNPEAGRAHAPSAPPPDSAVLEADVLRRKLALTRAIKAISDEDRADREFSGFIAKAEDELAVAEEACKLGRFAAATESLAAAKKSLDEWQKARYAREEAERKAKEEAERKAREEAARVAREKSERKAREEAERKTREKAKRIAWEKAEAERKAKRKTQKKTLGKVVLAIVSLVTIVYGVKIYIDSLAERKVLEERAARKVLEERAARKAAEEARLATVRKNRELGRVQLWAGGPYWATRNIGADNPEDSGLYFWWGDTVGYRRESNAWVASDGSSRNFEFSKKNTPTLGKDDSTLWLEGWTTPAGVLAPQHDAAHVRWGGAWRMPTSQELSDLIRKCDWTWTTRNGVEGVVVRGRGAYAGASIFLPAAGYGDGTSLNDAGLRGNYWSSVPYSGNSYSWNLYFYSGGHVRGNNSRYYWQPVRPVQGFTE